MRRNIFRMHASAGSTEHLEHSTFAERSSFDQDVQAIARDAGEDMQRISASLTSIAAFTIPSPIAECGEENCNGSRHTVKMGIAVRIEAAAHPAASYSRDQRLRSVHPPCSFSRSQHRRHGLLFTLVALLIGVCDAHCSNWNRRYSGTKRLVNHHGTHYFMLPSAIPLERGEGYFKSTLIALNSAAYGCSDKFSLGAGIHLPSIFSKRDGGPVWFANARLSGPVSDLLHIGITGAYLRAVLPVSRTEPDATDEIPLGFGTAMAMATVGSVDHQLTVAVGTTHDGQRFGRGPLVTVAGSTRLFPNVCIITEHWLFIDPDATWPLHSLGLRVLGQDMALDFGLAYERTLAKKTLGIGLPFASIVFNF